MKCVQTKSDACGVTRRCSFLGPRHRSRSHGGRPWILIPASIMSVCVYVCVCMYVHLLLYDNTSPQLSSLLQESSELL